MTSSTQSRPDPDANSVLIPTPVAAHIFRIPPCSAETPIAQASRPLLSCWPLLLPAIRAARTAKGLLHPPLQARSRRPPCPPRLRRLLRRWSSGSPAAPTATTRCWPPGPPAAGGRRWSGGTWRRGSGCGCSCWTAASIRTGIVIYVHCMSRPAAASARLGRQCRAAAGR